MTAPGWPLPLSSTMRLWVTLTILGLLTVCLGHNAAIANQEFCKEVEEQGPCRALVPRWYYNFRTNTCGLFIYGGCGGNNNNFESKIDCLQTCAGKR